MKRIIKFSVMLLALALSAVGCQHEELSTDQYGDVLTFSAFAPNPVYRGGELTILGSCLDQVKEVLIPGVDPITDFQVSGTGRECKLTLTVPVDGPEVGTVSIVGKDGKKLTAIGDLTYTEPVVFTSFSPAEAMPGDVITITGDYLNLIKEVIFEGAAYATEFESQSRYELKVTVPATAISGRIIIGDSNEVLEPDVIANKVYSDASLTIGDPVVVEAEAKTLKAGDEIIVTGEHLEMIKSVEFDGASVTGFTQEGGTKITLTLPAEAKDGEYNLVSFAGKSFKGGEFVTVKPSELEAAPSPVKAGQDLTITGKDLDLVVKVEVPDAGEVVAVNEGSIKFTMPANATEGNVTLTMANGATVEVPFTLVKPTVTEINPTEIVAGQGTITVTGTDLDLITKVTLGGVETEFVPSNDEGQSILVKPAATAISGKLVLTTENGTTVEPEQEITVTYDSYIVVNEMPSSAHIGETVTLKGSNFMMIDRIYIGDTKVTSYVTRTDTELAFVMPYNKVGTYSMKFELLSGEVEICPRQIDVQLELKITNAWEGNIDITWGDGGRVVVPYSAFSGVKAGAIMRMYYSQKDQVWAQAQINNGGWAPINFNGTKGTQVNGTLVPTNVYGWTFDDRVTEVELTQDVLDNINANHGDFGGTDAAIIIQGSNLIFTKIEIVEEIAQEKTLWEGTCDLGSWSLNWQIGDGTAGADNPNMFVDCGLKAGDEIRIYGTFASWWQLQFFDGHWAGQTEIGVATGLDNGNNINSGIYTVVGDCVKIPVTETLATQLTTLTDWGYCWILQGEGVVISKITVL